MSLQFGFRNQIFSPPTPLYAKVGAGMVVNTRTHKVTDFASLQAAMTAEGYSAKPGEIELSTTSGWENDNTGWWTHDGITPEPPTIPPTGVTVRTPVALPAQLASIQFATQGATLAAGGTVTINLTITGNAPNAPITVPVAVGDDAYAIATKVAAAAAWATAGITATVSGASVKLDAGAGETFDALSVTVA
jgi:hypothetical protein